MSKPTKSEKKKLSSKKSLALAEGQKGIRDLHLILTGQDIADPFAESHLKS